MAKKFSIKKLAAGVLALLMVVTALPVNGITSSVSKAAESDTVNVYRSYNPNNGEHLLTINKEEHDFVVKEGRSDEGIKWVAPVASSTPVYRSYNPNTGEHLLVPREEAEWLATQGWNNEGIKMYSDDNKGVPVYRVYNPNATDAGSHLYTSDKDEADYLVSLGWKWDNDGNAVIYAVDAEIKNELALDSVEDASGGAGNIVVAYFNKAVGDLTPSDVQIRRVSDDKLFSIEKVVMSSDKKTATLTLANSSSAGMAGGVEVLEPNVEYKLIATVDGESAEKVFTIPAVASDVTISKVDAKKNTITVGKEIDTGTPGYAFVVEQTLTVPDDMEVDYNELLGRTVTVIYDKTNTIEKLTLASEKVIYGAFKGDTKNKCLTDVYTKESYYISETQTGSIRRSSDIMRGAGTWNTIDEFAASEATDTSFYAYGKLVLNSNGTIKVAVLEDQFTDGTNVEKGNILVTSTNGTVVLGGKTEVDLKDYDIVCDGHTFEVSDIEEGDVVFYNFDDKFAEVYTVPMTGALGAVYDGKFTFAGNVFDVSNATGTNLAATARYIKSGAGLTDVDNTYLNALKASDEDVTVYFARTGAPVFLIGEPGETKTTTKTIVATDAAKVYSEKLTDYIRIKGSDGEAEKTYDIDISGLDFVVEEDGTLVKVGYADLPETSAGPAAAASTFTGFVKSTGSTGWHADTGVGAIAKAGATTGEILGTTDIIKTTLLTLTFDEKGNVIGINIEDTATNHKGDVYSDSPASLTGGLSVINTYQVSSSTPVYVYNTTTDAVTKSTYGDFKGSATKANTHIYSYDEKNVTAIVIDDSTALSNDATGEKEYEVVVKSYKKTSEATPKLAELTVIYAGEEKTYTKFVGTSTLSATPTAGLIYTIKVNADGETVNSIADTSGTQRTAITVSSVDSQTFDLGSITGMQLATTVTPTIAKFDATTQSYVVGTFADLKAADTNNTDSAKQVVWNTLGDSTSYIDTIVVTGVSIDTTAYAAAKALIDAANFTKVPDSLANTITTRDAAKTAIENALATRFSSEISGGMSVTVNDTDFVSNNGQAGSITYTFTLSKDEYSKTSESLTTGITQQ